MAEEPVTDGDGTGFDPAWPETLATNTALWGFQSLVLGGFALYQGRGRGVPGRGVPGRGSARVGVALGCGRPGSPVATG